MPAEATVFADVDVAVREWARDTVTSIDRRAFFGINDRGAFPQAIVTRIGGRDDAAGYAFAVWGGTWADAAAGAADLATQLEQIAGYTHAGVRLHGAAVDSAQARPDPTTDRPRYIVEATITAMIAA